MLQDLVYNRPDGSSWELNVTFAEDVTEEFIQASIQTIAKAYGIAQNSVHYLLEYGLKQSLQDSCAGPAKKAKDDGEDADTVLDVINACIDKRLQAIKDGKVQSTGRDPIVSTAKYMVETLLERKGVAVTGKVKAKLIKDLIRDHMDMIKEEIAQRAAVKRALKKTEVDISDLMK